MEIKSLIRLQNKMSLLNLDIKYDLGNYSGLFSTELKWLFNNSMPKEILFIPGAYNGSDPAAYIQKVKQVFSGINVGVKDITQGDPVKLINAAVCIVAGGGSLEKLLKAVNPYKNELKAALAAKKPFMGWDEGAVLVCPAYVEPDSIPNFPACLIATIHQIYVHFTYTTVTKAKMKSFFNLHTDIAEIKTFTDKPSGSGIRLEDDNIAIDFPGNSPPVIFKPIDVA